MGKVSYVPHIKKEELKKFGAGIYHNAYEKLGAHVTEIDGRKGVCFAVWAPCAAGVSVVGNFNLWDGRKHPMHQLEDSGVYELFIPGLDQGTVYKYEVRTSQGDVILKADPYGSYAELRPHTASIVWDVDSYAWGDQEWMKNRGRVQAKDQPVSVYEVHLGSWMRKVPVVDEQGAVILGSEFYNYRELAVMLADYVTEMGYTHVELMPVMEHPLDASWGYQITGYYAPTSRFGTPADFQYFIDHLHERGIGVILDWVPAHFPKDLPGLACFDVTHVYEHADPRQGEHPLWGTLIFQYGRPQVANFLISNALYWVDKFHVDGIRMNAVDSMLYLDYGRQDGQWIPNLFGSNENLQAVDFLRNLNTVIKKQYKDVLLIAEEATAWPQVTDAVKDGGLGFDYKWNRGWTSDFLSYMQCDPVFRSHHYGELTLSMLYAYSEDYMLTVSHDEVVHGKASMTGKMPGERYESRFSNLRAFYGYLMTHPGKKLLFMGQDFGQFPEWNEKGGLPWEILEFDLHRQLKRFVSDLNGLYRKYPALYEWDYHPDGFRWVDCNNSQDNIIIFERRTGKPEETLLIVCNFASVEHKQYRIGVPFCGTYQEIFNSEAEEYGGCGIGNPKVIISEAEECNEREQSIVVDVVPLGVQIFACISVKAPAK